MSLVKLKEIVQDTWLRNGGGPSRNGICYFMCNFIESNLGPWSKPTTFAAAEAAGQNFAQGTAMMNYAKAQNLSKTQNAGYAAVAGALAANRIYRVELWVGPMAAAVGAPNHEIIIITGADTTSIVYFDPNFGFFKPTLAANNNRQALEYYLNDQYGPTNKVGAFAYNNVRAISASTPLSFPAN